MYKVCRFFLCPNQNDDFIIEEKGRFFMPSTRFQRIVFAFLSVLITVPVFVCYNIAFEMGGMSNQVFVAALKWIPIEFAFAFLLETLLVGRLANILAFRAVNPAENKPFIVMTAIICSTVCLMCPMMSFIATIIYNGINVEFLANWMQKVVRNFPLAFFSQLFFIQPFVRFLFGVIFSKQLKAAAEASTAEMTEVA